MKASAKKNQEQLQSRYPHHSLLPSDKFVNTGLQRWEEIRNQWLSTRSTSSSSFPFPSFTTKCPPSSVQPQNKKPKRHANDIDVDEVIDLIVSNRWRQQPPKSSSTSSLDTAKSATRRRDDACFPSPVALPQMVDVLVDLWEAEGLDIWRKTRYVKSNKLGRIYFPRAEMTCPFYRDNWPTSYYLRENNLMWC